MNTQELDYDLPAELIAQQPAEIRSESRLLVLERKSGTLTDSVFKNIGEFLRAGDCLVLNDTKVLAARFYARRRTGGNLEGLFLKRENNGVWDVMLKGAGKVKAREKIWLKNVHGEDYCAAEVVEKKEDGKCLLNIEKDSQAEKILEEIGFAPVPPYIKRDAYFEQATKDRQRYQTVYAKQPGAIAAPTAGLHFTKELINGLEGRGIKFAYITLHVGEGTFKPVKTEKLVEHRMHAEYFSIDERNARIINDTKQAGGGIIAVGTTSVRTLEASAKDSTVNAMSGQTELFILPGYRFKIVDAMVTNFHLPRSTLLALVSAFTGLETILSIYRYAIEKRYRFYSYGDTMLII
ncbi:MAG: tRNA preQ1(34) S-adenosylmethionine ribosyltransferase-isomerase QueA [Sedimentisphaerales bacterium]|nr:tRNA preQ1(34) S-adenosylmethionine ribosyltransferase-isomerase QueA [Sedimentisphaerales bacterium]